MFEFQGFGGKFGVQNDRMDKSAVSFQENPEKTGTNYTKVKPDIGKQNLSNLNRIRVYGTTFNQNYRISKTIKPSCKIREFGQSKRRRGSASYS